MKGWKQILAQKSEWAEALHCLNGLKDRREAKRVLKRARRRHARELIREQRSGA